MKKITADCERICIKVFEKAFTTNTHAVTHDSGRNSSFDEHPVKRKGQDRTALPFIDENQRESHGDGRIIGRGRGVQRQVVVRGSEAAVWDARRDANGRLRESFHIPLSLLTYLGESVLREGRIPLATLLK